MVREREIDLEKKDLTTIDWPIGWSRMIDDDLIDRKWDLIKNSCNYFILSCKNADLKNGVFDQMNLGIVSLYFEFILGRLGTDESQRYIVQYITLSWSLYSSCILVKNDQKCLIIFKDAKNEKKLKLIKK